MKGKRSGRRKGNDGLGTRQKDELKHYETKLHTTDFPLELSGFDLDAINLANVEVFTSVQVSRYRLHLC